MEWIHLSMPCISPALSELLPKSGFSKNCGKCRPGRLHLVRVISRRVGPFLYMGSDRRSLWAQQCCGNGAGVRSFTGAAALAEKRVAARTFFDYLRALHRRRVALAGTYVAEAWPRGSPQNGRGVLANRLLFGFFLAAALNTPLEPLRLALHVSLPVCPQ